MKISLVIINEQVKSRAIDAVRSLSFDDPHEVVIRPKKSRRSLDQNALHWKRLDVVRMHIADSTGQIFSAEELHEFFKAKFLDVRLVEVGGESIPCRRTTTKLNTKEMSEFMDAIDRYCIERLHLYLPQPGGHDDQG